MPGPSAPRPIDRRWGQDKRYEPNRQVSRDAYSEAHPTDQYAPARSYVRDK